MTAISTIPNLGPASEAQFAAAGITTAEQLREIGADAAYVRVLASGARPHFIAYYALVMALMGRPWNDCRGAEKAALRSRFEALKAASSTTLIARDTNTSGMSDPSVTGSSELERFLDRIGVIPPNPKESAR